MPFNSQSFSGELVPCMENAQTRTKTYSIHSVGVTAVHTMVAATPPPLPAPAFPLSFLQLTYSRNAPKVLRQYVPYEEVMIFLPKHFRCIWNAND